MRDIERLKTERELVRIKIDDGNAFWKEIGVNTGVLKLMLLSLKLNAAKLKLVNIVRLNLMLSVQVNAVEEKLEESDGFEEIIDFLNARIYCLPTATIFAELERMRYENLTQKLKNE
ncbi:hypothetical protein Tco_1366226, partial [Tanacetum coccineum]